MNSTPIKTQYNSCSQCLYWTRHDDARMATHGSCAMRDSYRYSHEHSPCLFTPERFEGKPA